MKAVVVIPTYNERQNVVPLVDRLLALPVNLVVYFVDDGSPDGTGEVLEGLKQGCSRIRVLHRPGKLGLGTAYRHAFHVLLKEPYEYILEMDADFSHPPELIPHLIEACRGADLVIGSRYVEGGEQRNCSLGRRVLSRLANGVARVMLGLQAYDATAGFRCYRRELLEALDQLDINSNGYSFQVEMTYFSQAMGFRIREVPIVFEDRKYAKSKMSRIEIWLAIRTLLRLWFHRVMGRAARDRMRLASRGLGPVIRK